MGAQGVLKGREGGVLRVLEEGREDGRGHLMVLF